MSFTNEGCLNNAHNMTTTVSKSIINYKFSLNIMSFPTPPYLLRKTMIVNLINKLSLDGYLTGTCKQVCLLNLMKCCCLLTLKLAHLTMETVSQFCVMSLKLESNRGNKLSRFNHIMLLVKLYIQTYGSSCNIYAYKKNLVFWRGFIYNHCI